MKQKRTIFISLFLAALTTILFFSITDQETLTKRELKAKKKKARSEYFFRMLRDPQTNSIPANIRKQESEFIQKSRAQLKSLKKEDNSAFIWKEAGPNDVGGRTRALAVDRTNSNVIITGGVSGGIWKSTDKGNTWESKTTEAHHLSVTSIAQDYETPTTWYYVSGEFSGNSAAAQGGFGSYRGSGFYRSVDNGETWQQLHTAGAIDQFDSPLDYVSKVMINPITGSIFFTSNIVGVYRSTDKGETFSPVLGYPNDHYYVELDIHSSGKILATLSDGPNSEKQNEPGVYLSSDDGETWQPVISEGYENPDRALIAFAPSNENIAYLFTQFTDSLKFYKIDLEQNLLFDRTENLPDFGDKYNAQSTQHSYDMVLEVKPDDDNFVVFGGVNLFRTLDGLATAADSKVENWIGGSINTENIISYPNHHQDNHIVFFDPSDPNKLWSGHDGGLSYTEDVSNKESELVWIDKNNSYNVTQFYHVAISKFANDPWILGGAQDNGTPFFAFDGTYSYESADASSGDGSCSHFTTNYIYTSSQNGFTLKIALDENRYPIVESAAYVFPQEATGQLFINPFVVDDIDEETMYYPAGNELWRNKEVTALEGLSYEGQTEGWENLGKVVDGEENNHIISSIAKTEENPSHRIYLGLSNYTSPKIIKFENETFTEISIPDASSGGYVHDIAVNPIDGNEFIVTFSNYNVKSLFHTKDGGESYSLISGNLDIDGPSVRATNILPYNGKTYYFAATSVGLFSTTKLDSTNTEWVLESSDDIKNVVVNKIASRISDGRVVAATHGRGMFVASPNPAVSVTDEQATPNSFNLSQNYPNPFNPSTTISYKLTSSSMVSLKIYNSLGQEVKTLVNKQEQAGSHSVVWNAKNLASGVYYYTLTADGNKQTKKMILTK